MGAEHYCGDTESDRVVGILDVTADYSRVRPHLLGLINDCAFESKEALQRAG